METHGHGSVEAGGGGGERDGRVLARGQTLQEQAYAVGRLQQEQGARFLCAQGAQRPTTADRRSPVISESLALPRQRSLQHLLSFASPENPPQHTNSYAGLTACEEDTTNESRPSLSRLERRQKISRDLAEKGWAGGMLRRQNCCSAAASTF